MCFYNFVCVCVNVKLVEAQEKQLRGYEYIVCNFLEVKETYHEEKIG